MFWSCGGNCVFFFSQKKLRCRFPFVMRFRRKSSKVWMWLQGQTKWGPASLAQSVHCQWITGTVKKIFSRSIAYLWITCPKATGFSTSIVTASSPDENLIGLGLAHFRWRKWLKNVHERQKLFTVFERKKLYKDVITVIFLWSNAFN